LKESSTATAIGKYLIGQTPFIEEEKLQFLWRYWKWSDNHNTAATQSSHRLSLRLRVVIKFIRIVFLPVLSQISPTACLFISKIALKQDFIKFPVQHCPNIVSYAKRITVRYHVLYKLWFITW